MEEHTMDKRFDEVLGRFDTMDKRFDEIHAVALSMFETLGIVHDSVAMLNGLVRDLNSRIESRVVRAEHDALESRVARLEAMT